MHAHSSAAGCAAVRTQVRRGVAAVAVVAALLRRAVAGADVGYAHKDGRRAFVPALRICHLGAVVRRRARIGVACAAAVRRRGQGGDESGGIAARLAGGVAAGGARLGRSAPCCPSSLPRGARARASARSGRAAARQPASDAPHARARGRTGRNLGLRARQLLGAVRAVVVVLDVAGATPHLVAAPARALPAQPIAKPRQRFGSWPLAMRCGART
jgi:hypothetical protein